MLGPLTFYTKELHELTLEDEWVAILVEEDKIAVACLLPTSLSFEHTELVCVWVSLKEIILSPFNKALQINTIVLIKLLSLMQRALLYLEKERDDKLARKVD